MLPSNTKIAGYAAVVKCREEKLLPTAGQQLLTVVVFFAGQQLLTVVVFIAGQQPLTVVVFFATFRE